MARNRFVTGVAVPGRLLDDAGTAVGAVADSRRRQARRARGAWRRRTVRRGTDRLGVTTGTFSAWARVPVSTRRQGRDSVVMGAARVAAGCELKGFGGGGGRLGGTVEARSCVAAADVPDEALASALAALDWPLAETAATGWARAARTAPSGGVRRDARRRFS
jgi:hypothetical protein